jgi:hypothetical protein
MASSGKRKTTMAKLNRERRLLDRRLEKQARKDARKRAAGEAADPQAPADDTLADPPAGGEPSAGPA